MKQKNKTPKKRKILLSVLFVIIMAIILCLLIVLSRKPSNDRVWSLDQRILSYAEINENNTISIYNIRNFTYYNTSIYYPGYYNKTYNLNDLNNLWLMVEPFHSMFPAAHTFLIYQFNESFVVISVEIRKEVGESYDPIKGLLRTYELMYVIGDEQDLVKLRTNYRNDSVDLYPIKISQDKLKLLFLDMINRTNTLKENPEFYNTISSTCTTNIVDHVNKISPNKVPWSVKLIAPKWSDEYAYKLGLIDTNLSFQDAKLYFNINKLARRYENSSDFSLKIRQFDENLP